MINGKKILGLIPARGGSKGLPGKNVRELNGKPLIAWTIKQALESRHLDRVVVTTDDEAIARVSREEGAEVPFTRPAELATDTATSADVVIHSLDFFRGKGEDFDYIALLEPTSPLRKKGDIDRGIEILLGKSDMDALVSLGGVHLEHPQIVKKVKDGAVVPYADLAAISQRQQADEAYFPYGVIYLAKTDSFRDKMTFYGEKTMPFFIERWQNYEIDDIVDFIVTGSVMKEYLGGTDSKEEKNG